MSKILISDIDAHINHVLKKMLVEETEDDIFTSNEPGEILQLISKNPYNIVFLDTEFINRDERFAKNIINKSINKNIKIILMTTRDPVSSKILNLSFNVNDYLIKPFSKDEIIFKMQQHLKSDEILETLIEKKLFEILCEISNIKNNPEYTIETIISIFSLKIKELCQATKVLLYFVENNKIITCKSENLNLDVEFNFGEGIAGHVALTGKHYYSNEPYSDPFFISIIDEKTNYKTENILAFPLIVFNKVIGVIEISNKKNGFNDQDCELVKKIIDALALQIYRVNTEKENIFYQKFISLVIRDAEIGIYAVNNELKIKIWNKQMEKIYKLKFEDVKDKFLFEVLPAFIKYGFDEWLDNVLKNKKMFLKNNWEHLIANKEKKYIDLIIYPIIDEKNELLGFGILNTDKTKEKMIN